MAHRRALPSRLAGVITLAALALAGVSVGVAPATAAPEGQIRYVSVDGSNGGEDNNLCLDADDPCQTIQWAVDRALDGDTVRVGAGIFDGTVALTKALTIVGQSAAATTVRGTLGVGFLAGSSDPDAPTAATLDSLTITPGDVTPQTLSGFGIANSGADLTIRNSVISDSSSIGIYNMLGSVHTVDSTLTGNAIGLLQASGDAQLIRTVVKDNTAPPAPGSPIGLPFGVGIMFTGGTSLTVGQSTISGNSIGALIGYGVGSPGDDSQPRAKVAVTRSTVSRNSFSGIASIGADTTIDNSTISGNAASGILSESFPDGAGPAGSIAVTNSTVSDTRPAGDDLPPGFLLPADQAGIVVVDGSAPPAPPTTAPLSRSKSATGDSWFGQLLPKASELEKLDASILAAAGTDSGAETAPKAAHATKEADPAGVARAGGRAAALPLADDAGDDVVSISGTIVSSGDAQVPDCAGDVADDGYNLSSDAGNSCGLSAAQHDLTSSAPALGALVDNGGATETQLPAAGSPAIDAIRAGEAGCTDGATDQRGDTRPQGDACDIGAVEAPAPVVTDPPTTEPATTEPATGDPTTGPAGTTSPAGATPAGTTPAAAGGSAATEAGALPRTGAALGPAIPVGLGALLLGALLVAFFSRRRNAAKH